MSTAIDEFYNYLQFEKGYSVHTANSYKRDLKILFAFIDDIEKIDSNTIQKLVMQQNTRGKSGKSIRRLIASIRAYLGFLHFFGVLKAQIIIDVKFPKLQKTLPKTLSYEQVMLLLTYCNAGNYIRDKAVIAVLYSCGLRVSELVGLNKSDIDMRQNFIKVRGKGGRERYTPIGGKAIRLLHEYLKTREDTSAVIFVNKYNKRISTRAVQQMIKQRGELAGINFRVTPHMLRHAAASHLLQSSGDIRGVQEYLGHQSITSTQVYTHLDYMALAKVYDTSHPHGENANTTTDINDD